MARRPPTIIPTSSGPALLVRPKQEVKAALTDRLARGQHLATLLQNGDRSIVPDEAYHKWADYITELLKRSFSTDEYAKEFDRANSGGAAIVFLGSREDGRTESPWAQYLRYTKPKLSVLESIIERLDLIDESPAAMAHVAAQARIEASESTASPLNRRDVFVVHGRDDGAKHVVARFLVAGGANPIILHEQPSEGRTIIGKFQHNAASVAYAIVLITPDDVGGLSPDDGTAPKLQARARQNVVLELGYFLGKLGPSRVTALVKGELELPSDYDGVVYVPMDATEGWKLKLAQELKSANVEFDISKTL